MKKGSEDEGKRRGGEEGAKEWRQDGKKIEEREEKDQERRGRRREREAARSGEDASSRVCWHGASIAKVVVNSPFLFIASDLVAEALDCFP